MNTSYLIIVIAVAVVFAVGYFIRRTQDDGTIAKADQGELDTAIAKWGVHAPDGNMYISVQEDTAVGMMAESVDQLTAYRTTH